MGKEETAKKRTQIVAVYEADGKWKEKARELQVPISTAYRWVNQGDHEDRRGGRRFTKVNQEHRDFMVTLIENNPRITLKEMAEGLKAKFSTASADFSLSKTAISSHLDMALYTLKKVRFEPERANVPANKEKRKAFVEKLLICQGQNKPMVFMDETNFNIHISRSAGRSKKGTRCSTVAAASKGSNIHVIGAIASLGLIHLEVKRGSFKKEDAKLWMKTCLEQAMQKYGQPVVLVMDNAPCHSKVEDDILTDGLSDCEILRLSPYSPMFNPIENVWSVIKAYVKRELANKMEFILTRANLNVSMKEHRLRALEAVVQESTELVTPSLCNNCIANIQGKVSSALALEDMSF